MALIERLSIIIPLIVLVVLAGYYFLPNSGAFDKFKDVGDKAAATLLPNVSIGADKLKASTPGIEDIHKKEILKLKSTIESMKDKGQCFANYGGFTDLGEYGTSLQLNSNSNGGTDFTVLGGAGGKQVVTDLGFTIQGVSPCVIAGSSIVTTNFNDLFLNDKSWEEKSKQFGLPHYEIVSGIVIQYSTNNFNGNIIKAISSGKNIVADVSNNFKDGGYLYTPDGKSICFFPTVLGNNICDGSDKDGLDDDCLIDQTEDISIPRQFNEGKLKQCS